MNIRGWIRKKWRRRETRRRRRSRQLQTDLRGDGWTVITEYAPRMAVDPATPGTEVGAARLAEIQNVRTIIQGRYNADPANVKLVYLLGRVPQPYMSSGAEDGHSDHTGAWPSDTYYAVMADTITITDSSGPADLTGQAFPIWTDVLVNTTSARDPRNHNVPGDGNQPAHS